MTSLDLEDESWENKRFPGPCWFRVAEDSVGLGPRRIPAGFAAPAGISNGVYLMISTETAEVPRVDSAVIVVAIPGSTGEFDFEKLQVPKALTFAVPICVPLVSDPT